MQDPFTGQPTCVKGGRLPADAERSALLHDHRRRLEALDRFVTAAARVGIGTDPDDDLVHWEPDEVGLLAAADPDWHELDAAARAFRATLPLLQKLPLPYMGAWMKTRDLPKAPASSFRDQWKNDHA